MQFRNIVIALILIIILIIVLKILKHKKKKVILEIGPSLKDKGGMATVMSQIYSSHLKDKYNIKHISTYIDGKKFCLFFLATFRILIYKLIYRIELAHIHSASFGSFYRKSIISSICKVVGIKTIMHIHGACFEEFFNNLNPKKQKYIKKVLNQSEKIIVLSESWKKFFEKLVDSEKIEVMYNSVKVPEVIERKESKEIYTGLLLGRIGKRKGIYDVIEAVKELKKENINVKIIIAGDGEVDKAKNLVNEEKLQDNIEIIEWLDEEKKKEYLKKSDFYILPSYNEGLPMSVLEAMSFSLPVITSDVGGIPEIIHNKENGILIKPGNIKSIKESIKIIISNKEYREKLSKNAYKTIKEQFNLEKYLEKLEKIYLEIKKKNIKLCLCSSAGGHFMQLKQLFKMSEKYNTFILTEKNEIAKGYSKKYKVRYLMQQERKNISFILEFIFNFLKAIYVAIWYNPDVIISTGAGATTFVCLFIKLLGGKVIYIESFAKINSPTITGRIIYKFADDFYVQWEEMKKFYPKAHYDGEIY